MRDEKVAPYSPDNARGCSRMPEPWRVAIGQRSRAVQPIVRCQCMRSSAREGGQGALSSVLCVLRAARWEFRVSYVRLSSSVSLGKVVVDFVCRFFVCFPPPFWPFGGSRFIAFAVPSLVPSVCWPAAGSPEGDRAALRKWRDDRGYPISCWEGVQFNSAGRVEKVNLVRKRIKCEPGDGQTMKPA